MTESNPSGTPHEQAESVKGSCACKGAGPAISERLHKMFEPPKEAGDHFRQARIEFLKGIRGLLDYRIEKLSNAHKGTRITVE